MDSAGSTDDIDRKLRPLGIGSDLGGGEIESSHELHE